MATAQQTRDHEPIKRWTEERSGVPAIVKDTGGLLRIDFVNGPATGGRDPHLEPVDWSRWFQIFDDTDLVFLRDPAPESKFFKLVSSQTAEAAGARRARPSPFR